MATILWSFGASFIVYCWFFWHNICCQKWKLSSFACKSTRWLPEDFIIPAPAYFLHPVHISYLYLYCLPQFSFNFHSFVFSPTNACYCVYLFCYIVQFIAGVYLTLSFKFYIWKSTPIFLFLLLYCNVITILFFKF